MRLDFPEPPAPMTALGSLRCGLFATTPDQALRWVS